MRLEDMPVEILFYRSCQCGTTSRSFDQYEPCYKCGQKDQFRRFATEPISWALDRAVARLNQQRKID